MGWNDTGPKPGILEQADRIMRGLPPIPKYGILQQVQRIMRGLPAVPKQGILAQAQEKTREWAAGEDPEAPRMVGWSLYPPGSLPPDWDDPTRITYLTPKMLDRMFYGPRQVTELWRPPAPLAATPEQIARARGKRWIINEDGNEAKALSGATLSGLAEAITGDANDWRSLDFKGDPRTLKVGDSVKITPLLKKASEEKTTRKLVEPLGWRAALLPKDRSGFVRPKNLEKGEYLGVFRITVYNTAREWDHPAEPTKDAPGLGKKYSEAFLKDIDMQGSGIDCDKRLIQHDWRGGKRSGYTYVSTIRTATGEPVMPEWSAAVDPSVVPHGAWIYIDAVGWRKAVDTGGKIKSRKIDVYFAVSRNEAYRLDKQEKRVWRAK